MADLDLVRLPNGVRIALDPMPGLGTAALGVWQRVGARWEPAEINGIAHLFVTAGDFARSRAFYAKLLPWLGMKPVLDGEGFFYCVGGRTAFGVRSARAEHAGERFDQGRVGLHHVCFRARERGDVDAAFAFVRELGAKIVHPPEEGAWAPGYYSVLFEDPDGIRLEANYVPGKGHLEGKSS